jgi:hypothetical protein
MKKLIIVCLGLSSLAIKSQDQLFKKDNTKLNVKIIEVGTDEIKYKLHNNQTGPTYIESKSNVNVIIYENGQHEVLNSTPAVSGGSPVKGENNTMYVPRVQKFDSLTYYRYQHNISMNFLCFLNNEIGLIYQREFFASHFNIIIPFAVGVEEPNVTREVYFSNNAFTLRRKMFEVGFGINYYPSLATNVNYFIGPVFRYLQYDGAHNFTYRVQTGSYYTPVTTTKNTTLSRYCMSITNGIVIRTRSRLTATIFGSLGFKNDVINDPISDPSTGVKYSGLSNPLSIYFWSGFNVGFNF